MHGVLGRRSASDPMAYETAGKPCWKVPFVVAGPVLVAFSQLVSETRTEGSKTPCSGATWTAPRQRHLGSRWMSWRRGSHVFFTRFSRFASFFAATPFCVVFGLLTATRKNGDVLSLFRDSEDLRKDAFGDNLGSLGCSWSPFGASSHASLSKTARDDPTFHSRQLRQEPQCNHL